MELKNKVVVITGGTKGLGKALAVSFLKNNAKVVVCARKEDEFKNLPSDILGIKADVVKENEVKKLAKKVINKLGKIDIWINNAGIWLPRVPIEEVDWKRAHDLIEVNFFGTVYGSKTALIQMKKQNFGAIVNILSTTILDLRPNSSAYRASKYAVLGFTKTLKIESENTNVKVFSVYPGGMQTNFFDEKKPDNFNEYMDPSFVANKILENLKKESPEEELIIKRPVK
jgi:3-hydroxybutyrate dehydrogenase